MSRRIFGGRIGMDDGAGAMKSPPAAVKTPGFEFLKNTVNTDKFPKMFMAETIFILYNKSYRYRYILK